MSREHLLRIYALAVCFSAVICCIVGVAGGTYDLVRVAKPELTLPSYEYRRHQTNYDFFCSRSGYSPAESEFPHPGCERPALYQELERDAEAAAVRENSYRIVLETESRGGLQGLLRMSILVIVAVLLFLAHWRLARRIAAPAAPASLDPVSDKLELARAYIELGDTGNAKAALEEVMSMGDEAQRKEAKRLLFQIPE